MTRWNTPCRCRHLAVKHSPTADGNLTGACQWCDCMRFAADRPEDRPGPSVTTHTSVPEGADSIRTPEGVRTPHTPDGVGTTDPTPRVANPDPSFLAQAAHWFAQAAYWQGVRDTHVPPPEVDRRRQHDDWVAAQHAEMAAAYARINWMMGRPDGYRYDGGPVDWNTGQPANRGDISTDRRLQVAA